MACDIGAEDKGEVFREAFRVYEFLIAEHQKGYLYARYSENLRYHSPGYERVEFFNGNVGTVSMVPTWKKQFEDDNVIYLIPKNSVKISRVSPSALTKFSKFVKNNAVFILICMFLFVQFLSIFI